MGTLWTRVCGKWLAAGVFLFTGSGGIAGQNTAHPQAPRTGARAVVSFSGFNQVEQSEGVPAGWKTWSPRAEISPRFSVDPAAGIGGHGALRVDGGGNPGAYGAWQYRIQNITAGRFYRLIAHYRTQEVPFDRRCVSMRMLWFDANGRRARPPDYALDTATEAGWTRVEHRSQAPDNGQSLVIELALLWAAQGTVWWDDIRVMEETAAPAREVRVATIYHRPQKSKSAAESVEAFCAMAEKTAAQKPDVICLPEGVTVVGTGKTYADVSEPVPGPTTERLGILARKLGSYIVAGIYERVGSLIYNTAVLIDRKGNLAGTYRKTHLPYEEVEGGITPGDSYPVFTTDFGKVGILICWDIQFPEPARALALQGAEMILVPIWGGSEVLARARAIENHVFLVTSSYDMKTFIVDPAGSVLAEAGAGAPIAGAVIDLDRKILQPWLGDMKTRTWKERRPDLPKM
jgi:predicted amidohydrolase